jgi:hypothetical protein
MPDYNATPPYQTPWGNNPLSLLDLLFRRPSTAPLGQGAPRPSFPPLRPGQGPDIDRSDQNPRGNQGDPGNVMGPPGHTPLGGPTPAPMSNYDPWTVRPGAQRNPLQMAQFGLSLLQSRQPNAPRPYPWL